MNSRIIKITARTILRDTQYRLKKNEIALLKKISKPDSKPSDKQFRFYATITDKYMKWKLASKGPQNGK